MLIFIPTVLATRFLKEQLPHTHGREHYINGTASLTNNFLNRCLDNPPDPRQKKIIKCNIYLSHFYYAHNAHCQILQNSRTFVTKICWIQFKLYYMTFEIHNWQKNFFPPQPQLLFSVTVCCSCSSSDGPPPVAGLSGAPGPGPVLPGLGVRLPARPAPGYPSCDRAQPPGVPAAAPRWGPVSPSPAASWPTAVHCCPHLPVLVIACVRSPAAVTTWSEKTGNC